MLMLLLSSTSIDSLQQTEPLTYLGILAVPMLEWIQFFLDSQIYEYRLKRCDHPNAFQLRRPIVLPASLTIFAFVVSTMSTVSSHKVEEREPGTAIWRQELVFSMLLFKVKQSRILLLCNFKLGSDTSVVYDN
jgi:hypothetical protein